MSAEIDKSISKKYEIQNLLTTNTDELAWKAVDKKTSQQVLIKKICQVFKNSINAQSIFREIMFLQEFVAHDNIIKLLNVIRAENDKDIYLVFEYMDSNLHAAIGGGILEPIHKRYIAYQILKGLKYMHTGQVIHRDLKPSSILLKSDCTAKISDFGMARSVSAQIEGLNPVLTDYLANRWYKAPEILLGNTDYTKAVDMWSAGVIIAEMIAGRPIFPGTSTFNQLDLIIQTTFNNAKGLENRSETMNYILEKFQINNKKQLSSIVNTDDIDALDFLNRLIQFNPDHRLTVQQALEHPFLRDFHTTEEEVCFPYTVRIPLDDNQKFSAKEYRDKIYKDINMRKKEINRRSMINRHYWG
jgi:mitogen-activated protein kinase 15